MANKTHCILFEEQKIGQEEDRTNRAEKLMEVFAPCLKASAKRHWGSNLYSTERGAKSPRGMVAVIKAIMFFE